jgi:hypothetical protein
MRFYPEKKVDGSCLKQCNRSQSLPLPDLFALFLLPPLTAVLNSVRVA